MKLVPFLCCSVAVRAMSIDYVASLAVAGTTALMKDVPFWNATSEALEPPPVPDRIYKDEATQTSVQSRRHRSKDKTNPSSDTAVTPIQESKNPTKKRRRPRRRKASKTSDAVTTNDSMNATLIHTSNSTSNSTSSSTTASSTTLPKKQRRHRHRKKNNIMGIEVNLFHSIHMLEKIASLPESQQLQVKEYVSHSISASKLLEHVLQHDCKCSGPGLLTKLKDFQSRWNVSLETSDWLEATFIGKKRNRILHRPMSKWMDDIKVLDLETPLRRALQDIVAVCHPKEKHPTPALLESNADDLLVAIQIAKSLELVLRARYRCRGVFLGAVITDFISKYPQVALNPSLQQDLYYIVEARNKLLHQVEDTVLDDDEGFVVKYARVLLELSKIPPLDSTSGPSRVSSNRVKRIETTVSDPMELSTREQEYVEMEDDITPDSIMQATLEETVDEALSLELSE